MVVVGLLGWASPHRFWHSRCCVQLVADTVGALHHNCECQVVSVDQGGMVGRSSAGGEGGKGGRGGEGGMVGRSSAGGECRCTFSFLFFFPFSFLVFYILVSRNTHTLSPNTPEHI